MSFIKDALFGEEGTPARVEDIRSDNQIALGNDVIGKLRSLIGSGGLPGFEGPTTAPVSGGEQRFLDMLTGFGANGLPAIEAARGSLTSMAGGGSLSPLITGIAPGDAQGTFSQIGDILTGRTMSPDNPIVQATIQAAQRPIFERFEDDLAGATSAATKAGQFVQPGSSSPFELAKSRLQVGLANALGDTSSRVLMDNLTQERNRQSNLISTLGNLFESGQNRTLDAASATVPFNRGQVTGIIEAMKGSALPRLVEQFGLSQGQDEFQRQQDTLLKVLQLASPNASPQTVSIPGQEGTQGLIGAALPAIGSAFGGPIGAAAGKAVAGLF